MKWPLNIAIAAACGIFSAKCNKPEYPTLLSTYQSPATVHVRGYTTQNGYTVDPHGRRAPGVAQRDSNINTAIFMENMRRMKPYTEAVAKSKREAWGVFIFTLIGLWGFSATMKQNRERYGKAKS